jgi:hypothetical protein
MMTTVIIDGVEVPVLPAKAVETIKNKVYWTKYMALWLNLMLM